MDSEQLTTRFPTKILRSSFIMEPSDKEDRNVYENISSVCLVLVKKILFLLNNISFIIV